MCGRILQISPVEAMRRLYRFRGQPNLQPRWNLAPTQNLAAIRSDADGRVIVMLRWGLIPAWVKDPKAGPPLINARAETVATKPSFRSALKNRRCIVPADGFYEWERRDGRKQPWCYTSLGGEPFAFAGLWERWNDPNTGATVESCCIITVTANALAAQVHDRMPAILAPADVERWLDPGTGEADLARCLAPFPSEAMTARMVSPRVNSVRNDDPACLDPPMAETQGSETSAAPAKPAPPRQPSLF